MDGTIMTRSRATAKSAGSTFERKVADYLKVELEDDGIDRRPRNGAKDRGDIGGVKTIRGGRVVIECKDYGGQFKVTEWLREAETERGNDDAAIASVCAKVRGKGDAAEQVVFMTLETFSKLLQGGAPELHGLEAAPEVSVVEAPEED